MLRFDSPSLSFREWQGILTLIMYVDCPVLWYCLFLHHVIQEYRTCSKLWRTELPLLVKITTWFGPMFSCHLLQFLESPILRTQSS